MAESATADLEPTAGGTGDETVRPGWKSVRAYVFGKGVGERVKSIRTAWENARDAAGLTSFQLRNLRHEAASRFEEAGVLTTDVSKFLGHRNLSTTTRYLNTTGRRLRMAPRRALQSEPAESCKFLQRAAGVLASGGR